MKISTALASLFAAALLCSGSAFAQYTGPASGQAGGYVGPSGAALTTAAKLRDTGRDDQYARLQGRIVSHDGGKHYTFEDESGRLTVEISPKHFPAAQPIGPGQRVELLVQVDVDLTHKEFEVEHLRVLP